MAEHYVHLGRNIKRLREMLGIKQEALAIEMGGDWNQKKISLLESKDVIDADLLALVAKGLKMPVEAIENFNDDAAVNIISSTFNTHDHAIGMNNNCQLTFNPVNKIIELFERMLKDKEEMIKKLEEMVRK